MSKELDRAKNLVARRPIPPAIRELLEPLAAAAPEDEKLEFDDLYGIVNVLLHYPKRRGRKKMPSHYGHSKTKKKKPMNRRKKAKK